MIDQFIIIAFGLVLLASLFVIGNFSKLALEECRFARSHGIKLRAHSPFVLAASLATIAGGLIGISVLRVNDGLNGLDVGGSTPLLLCCSLALLLIGKVGFHWAATLLRPLQWYAFLVLAAAWIGTVLLLVPAR